MSAARRLRDVARGVRRVAGVVAALLALFTAAAPGQERDVASAVRGAVRGLIEDLARGDATAAAARYATRAGTATVGDGRVTSGHAAVRDLFGEIAKAGPVTLEPVDSIVVVPLGADAALAYFDYRWTQGGQRARGAITIVFAREGSAWRIVHDHTSTLAESAAPAPAPLERGGPPAPVRDTRACVITRIVDGDTVDCRGVGRVRLIGMDTPELSQEPFGTRAAEALAALAPVGDTVQLERDVEPRDRYNRTLGYLWRGGVLVNWRLVRDGWAVLLTFPPNVQYVEWLTAAQRQAREERLGLWAVDGFACPPADRRRGRCD